MLTPYLHVIRIMSADVSHISLAFVLVLWLKHHVPLSLPIYTQYVIGRATTESAVPSHTVTSFIYNKNITMLLNIANNTMKRMDLFIGDLILLCMVRSVWMDDSSFLSYIDLFHSMNISMHYNPLFVVELYCFAVHDWDVFKRIVLFQYHCFRLYVWLSFSSLCFYA
eukprot:980790_1